MSKGTKEEVMARRRRRYASAGLKYKGKLLDEAVELLGYHRKAAIRALRVEPSGCARIGGNLVLGRPKSYEPATLLPILKSIWFTAFQPCGSRLHALLPEWLPAYELDHRRIDADVWRCLLRASARTLDRLVAPLRVGLARRGGTCPGTLLRQSIPIRGSWTEEGPGWLEVDTVALCGGRLDDRHPEVAALINTLCQGALGQLLNHFLPTHLLKEKRRKGNRTVRVYGPALTLYTRVLAAAEALPAKKRELKALHQRLNPFALAREVERQKQQINARRLLVPK